MALITDPDNLSQGNSTAPSDAAWGTPTGNTVTITSAGSNLPTIDAGDFFEIRDHSDPANNGLYVETGGTPAAGSVTADKLTGVLPPNSGAAEAVTWLGDNTVKKNVMFDTEGLEIWLLEKGALSTDGVTMLAIHSFEKEEWKNDAFLISAAAFPMIGISFAAGQWQIGTDPSGNNSGWVWADDITSPVTVKTRRLIRNAGWDEIDSAGNIKQKYFNVTTLPTSGAFEDSANDLAYYRFGTDNTDTAATTDYEFAGEVNEPVKYFEEIAGGGYGTLSFDNSNEINRTTGDFTTDGTGNSKYTVGGQVTIRNAEDAGNNGSFVLTAVAATKLTVEGTPFTNNLDDTTAVLAIDNDNVFETFLRIRDADPNGKTFDKADLAAGGETEITSKVIKLGLSNATDTNISETDANIDANSPYTEIRIRYLPAAYNREVDSTTKRNFGIVIDVGTYSRENGSSAASTLFTSADFQLGAGEALGDYTGGSLIIHEGTDQGTHTISGTPVDNAGTLEITLTAALTATESNLSFTMERATPLTATQQEIYEKVQRQLRQAADIDETSGTNVGKTADELMSFIATNDVRFGEAAPANPRGGGTGVICEGFDSNDTNNYSFFDNGGVSRTFPFVAAGTNNFSQTLVDDSDGEFWLYFEYTTRTNLTDGAVVGPSGDTYDLESPGGNLPALSVNDYINVSGFADAQNNGLFIVTTVNIANQDYTVRRVDGENVGTAESGVTIDVDENPYPSPDAIIVDDNSGADIVGAINALSANFDFDYDNNTQGGRTAGTDAAVVLVAAGLETAQVAVVKNLTITRSTGLSFSVTSARERNYSNP